MFKQFRKHSNLVGIAASSTASGKIPTVGTLYSMWLEIWGVDASTRAEIIAQIDNISVKADGEEIINATPLFLLDLEKYYGDSFGAGNVDGILPIMFARPHLPSDSERSLFALGLADVDALTIEVKCGAALDAAISTMALHAIMTPEKRVMGQHVRIHRFPQNFPTTGDQEIPDLPRGGANEGYLAIHIEDNTGTISKVTVKRGFYPIFDQVPADMNNSYLAKNFRTRQTGYYHVDFGVSRDLTGFVPMANVKDWRQTITWATAAPDNYSIYTERIFGLNIKQ